MSPQVNSCRKQGRSGMTLIELIVCVAIVAILTSLAFQFSTRMRNTGQATATLSNLRVVAQSALLMASENNGIIDLHESERGEFKRFATLQRLLFDNGYLENREVFFSAQFDPNVLDPFMGTGTEGGWVWRTMGLVRDPSSNPGHFSPPAPNGVSGVGGSTSGIALRLSTLENPGNFPLVVDSSHRPPSGQGVDTVHNSWSAWFSGGNSSHKPVMRDNQTLLMAFADGHVEAANRQRVSRIVAENFNVGGATVMGATGQMIPIPIP